MIERFIRPHLRGFQPYQSARSEAHTADLFLDANELSLGSPVFANGVQLNRYPDPFQHRLRQALSLRLVVPEEMVFVGVGSDEIIDLLIRLTCTPGIHGIAAVEPTYGVYRVAAQVNDVPISSFQLDEQFQLPTREIKEHITKDTRIVFCCSPNNPTGSLLKRDDILSLASALKETLLVVDEAYIEFAESGSVVSDVSSHENLIVLRTFSKAWGLAGARVGYCIAHIEVISALLRIKLPYNLNVVSASLAAHALANGQFLKKAISSVRSERERLSAVLKGLPSVVKKVYPSDANFLLVEFADAKRMFDALYQHGIVVRTRSEERLRNCLRITIGTPEENDRVIAVVKGLI
jgi:histidinol-phosphate aminotransferase